MTSSSTALLASYRPGPDSFDEMVTAEGQLRSHWSRAGGVIAALGIEALLARRQEARRLLDDDGATYNPGGREPLAAAWNLDPLPVLIPSEEWAEIERGLVQRAELLDLVLTDVYGRRELLRTGLLPPELVLGHPGFLRPCDQVRLPWGRQLFTAAVDLAHDRRGRCTVMADRTQAPSGSGYALENRVVTSRVFPSLYRDSQVHRLAPFFRTLRSSLQAVAPASADEPRIVLLSAGPWSETAFEHAYLASYLGYPLVEGTDLTVRDGRVWLRSLGRLEPVDVILRRADAWFCDPLELRPDSTLGVPGLVEASRLGAVSIVNTLGSGVLENPGLLAYLPGLCERLLGQRQLLPSVATWWCGEDEGRRYVLDHLDELVIKPIAASREVPSVLPGRLTAAERDELRHQIVAQPAAWVGQEHLEQASAPTITAGGLEPCRSALRAFVVARAESYAAMPGGLTRVGDLAGDLSKDTWVLASEPEKLSGFWLQSGPPIEAIAPEGSMSSRAAENLFWLGRYAERAEAVARLLRTVHDRRNDFQQGTNPDGTECLRVLLAALTRVTSTYPGFVGDGSAEQLASPGDELLALAVDETRAGTLADAVRRLLTSSYAVRDQLSGDTWMVVGALEREILELHLARPEPRAVVQRTLGRIVQGLLALSGLAGESMVRDPGWRFMDAGRRIERGVQLSSLLRATVTVERGTATDSLLLESVLTGAESIITYRRRYRSHAQLETLLDLLVLDPDNPRSLAYQADQLIDDLRLLPGRAGEVSGGEPCRLALELAEVIGGADTAALSSAQVDGTRPALDAFLGHVLELFFRTADRIDAERFIHLLPQHSLRDLP